MESMTGLLQNLKLSEAEISKIDVRRMQGRETKKHQALGQLLSERIAHPNSIERALGKAWCPIHGIECKSLGGNRFLFTFNQASEKRKALEEKSWMFSNELLVITDLDEARSIDDIEFNTIPIWIRVTKIPIGLMNKAVAEAIGNKVGEFFEVEEDNSEVMVGKFLRIKIKLDVRRPLMRGVMLCVGNNEEKWCPIIYEYLPDFCYICGVIGHTDKACNLNLNCEQELSYNKSLRWTPSRFRGGSGKWKT
jgi:hypothetical protein